MSDWYRRDGSKYEDFMEAARDFERMKNRRVAIWKSSDVTVSTVFLSIDHQWGDGPPLIFETMVFGGPLDSECERYSTEQEAIEGHERWVEKAKRAASDL